MICENCGAPIRDEAQSYYLYLNMNVKKAQTPGTTLTSEGQQFCRAKCAFKFARDYLTMCKENENGSIHESR
jgi:hypothetical protein